MADPKRGQERPQAWKESNSASNHALRREYMLAKDRESEGIAVSFGAQFSNDDAEVFIDTDARRCLEGVAGGGV